MKVNVGFYRSIRISFYICTRPISKKKDLNENINYLNL